MPSHNKAHENFNAEQKWFADIKQELITDAILAAWEKIFGLLDFKDQDKVIETKWKSCTNEKCEDIKGNVCKILFDIFRSPSLFVF